MALIEPFSEHEVRAAVDWAVNRAPASVYIRLVSVGWAVGFEPPAVDELVPGRGTVLRAGSDALFVAAGPVMVGAPGTADLLEADGIEAGVARFRGCAVWTGRGSRRWPTARRSSASTTTT